MSGVRFEGAVAGNRSVCVRLCDGFAFPVGAYHGESDRASHEATCRSECPGAATALYVLPSGSEQITDSVNARSGQRYSALPDAFHYTTFINEACSCHRKSGGLVKSLLHDFTLRRGDAVMTARGFRVFHGSPQYPFRRKDFVALNRSPDIAKKVRATYQAIERASLGNPSTEPQPDLGVAQRGVASQKVSATDATGRLEHQASR